MERLSLNQATVKHLGLEDAVALCVRHDIPAIGLWRDRVAEAGLKASAAAVRAARAARVQLVRTRQLVVTVKPGTLLVRVPATNPGGISG
jgi:hypothetical protein